MILIMFQYGRWAESITLQTARSSTATAQRQTMCMKKTEALLLRTLPLTTNGQGKVVINNGTLRWYDYQEHAADDMSFMSANGHDHRG